MNRFKKTVLAATAALALGFGANAHALVVITIDDGAGGLAPVSFNGATSASTGGFITFDGWNLNISALSNPGSLFDVQLNSQAAGAGAVPITVVITDNAQVGPLNPGTATAAYTPTTITNADVSFRSLVDGQLVLDSGVLNTGQLVAITGTAPVVAGNPYTIRHEYSFTPTGGPVAVTGDATTTVAPVPEPGTMMLMGSGLLGLGLWRKFKK